LHFSQFLYDFLEFKLCHHSRSTRWLTVHSIIST
jgi:hypothetical protein